MRNPLIVGAIIAALATIVGTVVTSLNAYFQAKAQLRLEAAKAETQLQMDALKHEASLITNAIQHGGGNPDRVAENLSFLLDAGLISEPDTRAKLRTYLEKRIPGKGASGSIERRN